jgi:hypothetical protein
LGVYLVATNNPEMVPRDWTYTVSITLTGQSPISFPLLVTGGSTIDLTIAAPVLRRLVRLSWCPVRTVSLLRLLLRLPPSLLMTLRLQVLLLQRVVGAADWILKRFRTLSGL